MSPGGGSVLRMPTSVIAERLGAQLLSGPPARDAVAVADRLLAVQAQDARGIRLAVRARTRGLATSDVDAALADASLVISWLNRGTLHLVRAEDYPWLQMLTTPQLATGNARRLMQEGVPPERAERGVAAIERALAKEGPLTRSQLKDRIDSAGVRTQGQALVHLLLAAALRGITVRGPMVGTDQAFVLVRDWLPSPPPIDRDAALVELARRFLRGHGPADDRDLARWAGLALRDARSGLNGVKRVRERPDGLLELSGQPKDVPALPPPRLLGAFDPLLLGWVDREPIVGVHRSLVTDNGVFRPFALVRGRAVATWRIGRGGVELAPFEPLGKGVRRAIERDGADVLRFLTMD